MNSADLGDNGPISRQQSYFQLCLDANAAARIQSTLVSIGSPANISEAVRSQQLDRVYTVISVASFTATM